MRRQTLRDENGSILVEMALTLPFFVLILAGITNYTFWIVGRIQLQEAASAGAAYATIPGNSTNTAGMITAARASAPYFRGNVNVTAINVYSCTPGGATTSSGASCPGGGGPLLFAQVTTSAGENPVLSYVGMSTSLTMQGFASYEVVP